ncbi:flagellar protein FlaG [Deefgea tanakiae]|uniref:Flagellar protein FlaG n=1 Tax=Deefgea tanakiae TaxID=2865840 RepID=A0ABX8Z9F9_9NEIS|nr:flagellar protein FlaG [Deefgea tanakiae]QZA79201.1 flagellar protein FlaG [Deefgea tanakiae]
MQISSVNTVPSVAPQLRQDEATNSALSAAVSAEKSSMQISANPIAVQPVDEKEFAKQIDDSVKKINETVKSLNPNVGLEFSTDEDTQIRLVKLIDIQSKEVLRQIPNEEVLAIAKALDKLQGLLVRDKA